MVGEDHQITDLIIGVHPSAGIGEEEIADPQELHHPHREDDLIHGVALVKMKTSLHGHNLLAGNTTEDQLAVMALYGGDGEIRYLTVPQFFGCLYLPYQTPQACAQDDTRLRRFRNPGFYEADGFFDCFQHIQEFYFQSLFFPIPAIQPPPQGYNTIFRLPAPTLPAGH